MGVIHDMGGRMGYGAVAINVTKKCFINLGKLSFRGASFIHLPQVVSRD
jgi:hypothetical protein